MAFFLRVSSIIKYCLHHITSYVLLYAFSLLYYRFLYVLDMYCNVTTGAKEKAYLFPSHMVIEAHE
jgi:hypothetical protein